MRKITQNIINAFLVRKSARQGNTHTDGTNLFLHNNLIASHVEGGISITTAGWDTRTTFDRLNAIPGVSVGTRKFQTFLNGVAWDGKPTIIKQG